MKTYVSNRVFDANSKNENSAQYLHEVGITSVTVSRQCSFKRHNEYIQAISTTNGFISLFLRSSQSSLNNECRIDIDIKSSHMTESSSNNDCFLNKLICLPSPYKKENCEENHDDNAPFIIIGGGNDGTMYVWSIHRKIDELDGHRLSSSETSSLSYSLTYSNIDIHNGSQISNLQTNHVGNKCISADINGIFCLWKIKSMKHKNTKVGKTIQPITTFHFEEGISTMLFSNKSSHQQFQMVRFLLFLFFSM